MSVIQRIRDRGAWIIFGIIALALIAFILQDGVRRGSNTFSNTTTLGVVNGEKLERTDFEDKLAIQERAYAARGGNASREEIMASLWNEEVERIVLSQEYEKLGLQFPPKELSDVLFSSENSPLKQEFTDPQTGVFDVNKAKDAISQIKKSKNADQIKMVNSVYINPTIEEGLRNKYQALLLQSAYIPKWLLEKQAADKNAVTSFSYIYVPYASVADSLFPVSDEEITGYVKKHSKEYQNPEETRNISFVSFSAAPSKEDTANVLNELNMMKADFAAAKDVNVYLAKVGTESPFYDSYFSKTRIQQAKKDSLVKIPVGGLYGPYQDGNNFVIARMVDQKQWPDSAKVRHILIGTVDAKTGQPTRTDSVAKKLADSIEAAIKTGADFTALCTRYSDDAGSRNKGGVYGYFPQGQMVAPFNEFAFDKPVGTKGVVKTDYGYHYIEVLGQKNPGTAYKIAYLSKPIVASNETISAANTAAAAFAASGKNAKLFNETAIKEKKQVREANNIKQNDYTISVLGPSRQLVRWIFEHDAGEISEPTEIGDQYIVAMVSAINLAGTMSAFEARPRVESIVRNQKKSVRIIETKFKGNTLESYAASSGAQIARQDSLAFSAPFIPGIGNEPKVIGAGFNKTLLGKASAPIAGTTGVFAIKVDAIGAKAAMVDETTLKLTLLQAARSAVYRSGESLRKSAEVKDSRSKFY